MSRNPRADVLFRSHRIVLGRVDNSCYCSLWVLSKGQRGNLGAPFSPDTDTDTVPEEEGMGAKGENMCMCQWVGESRWKGGDMGLT